MVTNFCWPPKLRLPGRSTSKEQVIDKHSAMRDEAVVTDRDEFADERVRLDAAALADGCSLLYLNERSDEGVIADVTAIQVCRLYDGHVRAELYVGEPDRTLSDRIHVTEF